MIKYEDALAKLVQCETVSYIGQSDLNKFRNCQNMMSKLFPKLWEQCFIEDFSGSLLIKWPGKKSENPILLMNHHDVVEAQGKWNHDPFGGEIEDGIIYGRGTFDTKGGLCCMLAAAEELCEEGFVPNQDIYFNTDCNEETTGAGADEISAELVKRNIRFALVLDEGGPVIDNKAYIGISEKSICEVKFVAKGPGGHASRVPKDTPLVRLGRFMAYVDDHRDEIFTKWIEPSTNEEEQTTIAFTVIHGSECINVIPAESYVITSMRCSHIQGTKGSIEAIKKVADMFDIETIPTCIDMEVPISDTDSVGYKKLIEKINKKFPDCEISPFIMAGATDSKFFTRVSDCVLRFLPFRTTMEQYGLIHGIDENINVSSLYEAVDFYKEILREIY